MITAIRPQDLSKTTGTPALAPMGTQAAAPYSATVPLASQDTVTFSGRNNTAQKQRKAKARKAAQAQAKHKANHPNDNSAQAHKNFVAKTRSNARQNKLDERNAARLEKYKNTEAKVIEHPATASKGIMRAIANSRLAKWTRNAAAGAMLATGLGGLQSCEKDPLPTPDPDPTEKTWSEGQPYAISDADAKATFYDYIMPGGLALPSYDAPVTYNGIDDPALAADIRQSLQDDKVPNPDKWVNKLNDPSFKEKVGNDPYIAKFLLTGPSNSNPTVLDVTETSLSRLLENTNGGIKYMDQAPPGITGGGSSKAFVHIDENNLKTLYLNREYAMADYGGPQRATILNESMETTRNYGEPLTQDEQLYQLVLEYGLNVHDAAEHFDHNPSHPTTSQSTQVLSSLNRYGLNGFDSSAETLLGDRIINNPNSKTSEFNTGEELIERQRSNPAYSGLSTASKPMRPDMAEYGHKLIGANPHLTTIGRSQLLESYTLLDKLLDNNPDLRRVFENHLPAIKN